MNLILKIDNDAINLDLRTEELDIKARVNLDSIAYYAAQLLGRIPSKVEVPGTEENLVELNKKVSNG